MYSKIANNSFSYLLTINEFRNQIPAEIRPSWIKITTITMVSSFVQAIDINKLRKIFNEIGSFKMRRDNSKMDGFEWKLKPTTFYNQVTLTYHDTYSTKSVKVFPNGSIQVAGCCDLFDCKRIITQLTYIFKTFLGMTNTIPVESFRVVMINSNFSLNYNINLNLVADWFENYNDIFKVSFEPDRYSAVKVKFKPDFSKSKPDTNYGVIMLNGKHLGISWSESKDGQCNIIGSLWTEEEYQKLSVPLTNDKETLNRANDYAYAHFVVDIENGWMRLNDTATKKIKGKFSSITNKIKLSTIIRALEGPIALLPCVSLNYYEKCNDCSSEERCNLNILMAEVRDSMLKVLENKTLASFHCGIV